MVYRLSKNKNRLKKNVREYMEMQDEVIMEELTESGKLTDDYIASLVPVRKQHESTQFVSVLSIGLHEEDDIDYENRLEVEDYESSDDDHSIENYIS